MNADNTTMGNALIGVVVVLVVVDSAVTWITVDPGHLTVIATIIGSLLTAQHFSEKGGSPPNNGGV